MRPAGRGLDQRIASLADLGQDSPCRPLCDPKGDILAAPDNPLSLAKRRQLRPFELSGIHPNAGVGERPLLPIDGS